MKLYKKEFFCYTFLRSYKKRTDKELTIRNIDFHGVGVRGRNSDNKLIKDKLGWEPIYSMIELL